MRAVLHQRWRSPVLGVGWPSAAVLQGMAANHGKLRRSRAGVVSVAEKARRSSALGGSREGNVSEPLMKHRKRLDDIEAGGLQSLRDEPGGCLLIGQAVSGVEAARARLGLWCGTWEPVVVRARLASGAGRTCGGSGAGDLQAAETARGRVPGRGAGADRLVVAVMPGNAGGAKGTGCPGRPAGQPRLAGGAGRAGQSQTGSRL
jgi:hypothetical protein